MIKQRSMEKCSISRVGYVVLAFCIATTSVSLAQTFTTLAVFDGTQGQKPTGTLVQGINGNLYGTTQYAGAVPINNAGGTVFRVSVAGTLTSVHNFAGFSSSSGDVPYSGPVLGVDGNLYGTNSSGGIGNQGAPQGYGTVFSVQGGGAGNLFNLLYQFHGNDGSTSQAALALGADGNFYGTTLQGGTNCLGGCGTVFKVTSAGALTTLYNFCLIANCVDGAFPDAAIVLAADGNFYGTTVIGGANSNSCGIGNGVGGCGVIFKITPAGTLTTLYSFCSEVNCADGRNPFGGLVQASNGNFYGTTKGGGASAGNNGTVFEFNASTGKLTTLYSFCVQTGCPDGSNPESSLVQGTDGNFYGTTSAGGANGSGGTIFEITGIGSLTTLHSFCSQAACADGDTPVGALMQATNGNFYGTTEFGGGNSACGIGGSGCGTVFSISMGLGPFVQTVPTVGSVGSAVIILGNNLADTTSVTFNGAPAIFFISDSKLSTHVPAGATTGIVQVTTSSGTLSSKVAFQVTP